MKYCRECKHLNECRILMKPDDEAITDDGEECGFFEQRTNFDKVTLSPKTLAEFVNKAIDLAIYHEQCFITPCNNEDCVECTTRWLEQEARDENAKDD